MLTSIGASFGSLQSTGLLSWHGNGMPTPDGTAGSVSFYASARAVLCPTTTTYHHTGWADDSLSCCTAYCATATDC